MKKLILIIIASLILTGCGQTGPLYLPKKDNARAAEKVAYGSTP